MIRFAYKLMRLNFKAESKGHFFHARVKLLCGDKTKRPTNWQSPFQYITVIKIINLKNLNSLYLHG